MRIPNVALSEEARWRVMEPEKFVGVDWGRKPSESVLLINGRVCRTEAEVRAAVAGRRSGKTEAAHGAHRLPTWFECYGIARRKPTERCAVMGDGIEVVRGVVVE